MERLLKFSLLLSIAAFLVLAGCAQPPVQEIPKNQSPNSSNSGENISQPGPGIANPASEFCAKQGYRLELRGQEGICVFPNGRECEEWAFFRGECTDADSFEMVEEPGFVANPKSISYKFYHDGRLVLSEIYLRSGNSSEFIAWISPKEFARFVSMLREAGFESFNSAYSTCGGPGGTCPTDMPSIYLKLIVQGKEKAVSVYAPAQRPKELDKIIKDFKTLFEKVEFVEIDNRGCTLMQNRLEGKLACFGCAAVITSVKCSQPPPGWEKVAGSGLGSCTVDAQGACAYQPPQEMTRELCEAGRGKWNECGSACRGAPEGTPCILMCVQYCECGGIAGFGCPTGYFCTDYLPKGAADAMGICKPVQ